MPVNQLVGDRIGRGDLGVRLLRRLWEDDELVAESAETTYSSRHCQGRHTLRAMASSDTIHALATGPGRAGIAILRLSGPGAADILAAIAGHLPRPRQAALRPLRGSDNDLLDRALVFWFPGPSSFTGEDVAELQIHGGSAIIAAVDLRLCELGSRPAEAGEFSRRAFLNGKIDLLEAEGLADLIDAETEAQRQQALRQSEGGLSRVYEDWASRLRRALALQEAELDFPDETESVSIEAELGVQLDELIAEFVGHLSAGQRAERLRTGIVVCVTGAPNVGKSSLVNCLVQEEVSIVSARAGTTRDLVEARLVLAGVPVTLVDTAGLRDTEDEVEAEGVRRARARAAAADLVLEIVVDGPVSHAGELNVIRVVNKIDLAGAECARACASSVGVSARTGEGVPELLAVLSGRVHDIAARTPHPAMTRGRHRSCIETARHHLVAARHVGVAEFRGEELRLAMHALGRLTGRVDIEDVLDTIFSSFCIGK